MHSLSSPASTTPGDMDFLNLDMHITSFLLLHSDDLWSAPTRARRPRLRILSRCADHQRMTFRGPVTLLSPTYTSPFYCRGFQSRILACQAYNDRGAMVLCTDRAKHDDMLPALLATDSCRQTLNAIRWCLQMLWLPLSRPAKEKEKRQEERKQNKCSPTPLSIPCLTCCGLRR
ncbi:hypothetical protein LZ30DRAFT_739437 [Colletotrichum cereale]|nr:hypothetical protein LZ30DRAFT_739437 [Colletotrichum cereale]